LCGGAPRVIFSPVPIEGARIIELRRISDERGFFARAWCEKELAQQGLEARISQVNVSASPRRGTLRGLHFQRAPHDETKIVRCTRGSIFDVVVDLRPESPTFRKWYGTVLDHETGRMLYAPRGTAHGFLTLTDDAEVMYMTSSPYEPAAATGVRFDDPAFDIQWPGEVAVVSAADRSWPDFDKT
jgi:dTDP-4-dehydrorhamnose 3,5-epimerase